jgi:hypothetical protein
MDLLMVGAAQPLSQRTLKIVKKESNDRNLNVYLRNPMMVSGFLTMGWSAARNMNNF